MGWVAYALDQDDTDSANRDRPLLVPPAQVGATAIWTQTGEATDADESDDGGPTTWDALRGVDGAHYRTTKPASYAATWYYVLTMPSPVLDLEFLGIFDHNFNSDTSLSVEIADTGDFLTSWRRIYGPTVQTADQRFTRTIGFGDGGAFSDRKCCNEAVDLATNGQSRLARPPVEQCRVVVVGGAGGQVNRAGEQAPDDVQFVVAMCSSE